MLLATNLILNERHPTQHNHSHHQQLKSPINQIFIQNMDRTHEFKSCVASIRSRTSTIPEQRQRLLNGYSPPTPPASKQRKAANGSSGGRSEFAKLAGGIGRDIHQTTIKLSKLAQLAKRRTLFDDRPVEISELTYIIKQDIAQLNQQIAQLQVFVKQNLNNQSGKKQVDEHNNNVVMMLQSKLADTSLGFKDVLEIRTQNMKATRDRTEQFQSNTAALTGPQSDSPLYSVNGPSSVNRQMYDPKGKGKAAEAGYQQNDYLALDMGAGGATTQGKGGEGFMQMQMTQDNSDAYLQQRSTAIESIESTITELGSIFSQLATMVAQQGEQVQRIDQDTADIENNMQSAQGELLKYYSSISGNRMLMLKIFGMIIVFFLLFVLIT